jgi:transcriptional regulator NrdR family protein
MDSIDKIIKSIFALNPTAQFTFKNNNIDSIEWLEGTTPISKSDLEAKISTIENEIEQEKQAAVDKKASGKQKLKDLGLDDAEIKALIGV